MSYLSPDGASSLKAPLLPTKPLWTTLALVPKAYMAAGQAAGCLHTMAVTLSQINHKDRVFLLNARFVF